MRQANYVQKGVWWTIGECFTYSFSQMLSWVNIYVIVILILLLPILLKAADRATVFSYRYPLAVTALMYCLYASMFAPGFYALGYWQKSRYPHYKRDREPQIALSFPSPPKQDCRCLQHEQNLRSEQSGGKIPPCRHKCRSRAEDQTSYPARLPPPSPIQPLKIQQRERHRQIEKSALVVVILKRLFGMDGYACVSVTMAGVVAQCVFMYTL